LTVSVDGNGTVEPFVGPREYSSPTIVTLTAKPDENSEFERWIGDVSSPDTPETEVVVDRDKAVVAAFVGLLGAEIPVKTGDAIRFTNGVVVDLQNVDVPAETTVIVTDVAEEIGLPEELQLAGSAVEIDFESAGELDFSEGVVLRLPVDPGADPDQIGVFHLNGTEWHYLPTTVEDGSAVATATSFSTFAVLAAETSAPVESSVVGFRVEQGEEIVLSASPAAQIWYSTTGPDYPGDYQLYEPPLAMPGGYFEFYAVAVEPNKRPSEATKFRYVDADYTVVIVKDEAGEPMNGVGVWFIERSERIYTDEEGFAAQRIIGEETIIIPFLENHVFEPSATIGGRGGTLTYVGKPSVEQVIRTDLAFNPVEFQDPGKLNPFVSPRIREAMNRLIDRHHLASIAGEFVYPIWTFLTRDSFDYGFMEDVLARLETSYAYDLDGARQIIEDEMKKLGAELRDNVWYYSNEPVELIFIIRSEDERTEFGNYIAAQLESIGFRVEKQYKDSGEAMPIWRDGDPTEGLWHLVTGGWSAPKGQAMQTHFLKQMYTPEGIPFRLWEYYTPVPELVEAADMLSIGVFESLAERKDVFEQGLKLALEDSVRIWLTAR
jgi:hypothetical protein